MHVKGDQVDSILNNEWRKAIRHRNHLWRVFLRDQTDINDAVNGI